MSEFGLLPMWPIWLAIAVIVAAVIVYCVAYGWSLILQAWIVFRLGRWPTLAEHERRSNG